MQKPYCLTITFGSFGGITNIVFGNNVSWKLRVKTVYFCVVVIYIPFPFYGSDRHSNWDLCLRQSKQVFVLPPRFDPTGLLQNEISSRHCLYKPSPPSSL